jgi:Glycosyltransferases, probably involved in cell wall biogenesis
MAGKMPYGLSATSWATAWQAVWQSGWWVLVVLVVLGAAPLAAGAYQFLLVGAHRWRDHYDAVGPSSPRVAILVPAWNEGAVLDCSIERLVSLDYPGDQLRVYVVDDASTDDTPQVVQALALRHHGQVVHVRREKGGEGKAHTLNHGLREILADDWMQALLIMDADVVYEASSLRRMTRHLADPRVGAVTAYIKEGSRPGNYLTRFVAFEYAAAQAGGRRAQNVLGAMACLAGGAQLLTRENLIAVGGRIDPSTLAEDTVTTFLTQLGGRRVVFEPHAVVWAEEPATLSGLCKQRLRWARGNIQVTRRFRSVWFRPSPDHRLGSIGFGILWFCLLLLPALMIASCLSLLLLYVLDVGRAWQVFHALWIVNAVSWLFITSLTLALDPPTGRRVWREALLFPGAISLSIILLTCVPVAADWLGAHFMSWIGPSWRGPTRTAVTIFSFAWVAGCMAVAWLAKRLESTRFRRLSPLLIYIGGYGPLLCMVTLTAYIAEMRNAEMRWDKTEKTGQVDLRSG